MKDIVGIDNMTGKMVCYVTTTDPTLIQPEGITYIDISNHKNKKKISTNPKYYSYMNGEFTEMSDIEKKNVDEKLKPPKSINPLEARLKELEDKVAKLEKKP